MKTPALLALILASTASLSGAAENGPVASPIAGFIAFDVPGTTDPAKPQLSLKSIGFVRPIEFEGTTEAVRGRVLIDTEATWRDGEFGAADGTPAGATHYIEIVTGPRSGVMVDIVKTNAVSKELKLGQTLPANTGKKVGYRIRKHWTLGSLFGSANDLGLLPGTEDTADKVAIYYGRGHDTFYYNNGWRRTGSNPADQSGYRIYPDDGIAITRTGTNSAITFIKGMLKTGRANVAVMRGTNLLGNVYPVAMTLGSSGLYTGDPGTGLRPGTAATADQVLIFNGTAYDAFYYQRDARLGTGWRKTTDPRTDAAATEIAAGSAIGITRRAAPFNWRIPAHPR
jgi:hypothetical protein